MNRFRKHKQTQALEHPSARSPFAGCAIMVAALLVMVFLIVFSTMTLFRQFNEISKFTAAEKIPLEVSSLADQEASMNALVERVESFRQQLAGDSEAALSLSVDELNLAIAAYGSLKDLRGSLRVIEIGEDAIRMAISFQLNGKPRLARKGESGWIASDPRYLNATMVAKPALLKGEVVLRIEAIEVPGAKVPREFIEQMSPYRITERYLADPLIGPAMARLTRVSLADGKLVFGRVPSEKPADQISDEQVDSAGSRFFTILGIAACVFLVFAGVVVFLGLRAKATRG